MPAHRLTVLTRVPHQINVPVFKLNQFKLIVQAVKVNTHAELSQLSLRVIDPLFNDIALLVVFPFVVIVQVPVSHKLPVHVLVMPADNIILDVITNHPAPAKVPVNHVQFNDIAEVFVLFVIVTAQLFASKKYII